MDFIDQKTQQLRIREQIEVRMKKVLEHGQYIMGPEVQELENQLATFAGTRHCISVASGTDALLIAIMSLGLGPGDEVITHLQPAFNYLGYKYGDFPVSESVAARVVSIPMHPYLGGKVQDIIVSAVKTALA